MHLGGVSGRDDGDVDPPIRSILVMSRSSDVPVVICVACMAVE